MPAVAYRSRAYLAPHITEIGKRPDGPPHDQGREDIISWATDTIGVPLPAIIRGAIAPLKQKRQLSWDRGERYITEFQTGTGSIRNCVERDPTNPSCDEPHEHVPGGYPTYRHGTPQTNSDGDGMPDAWETAHGLDPEDPQDAHGDRDQDGYTNIEEYANSLLEQ